MPGAGARRTFRMFLDPSVTLRLLPEDHSVLWERLVSATGVLAETAHEWIEHPAGRLLV